MGDPRDEPCTDACRRFERVEHPDGRVDVSVTRVCDHRVPLWHATEPEHMKVVVGLAAVLTDADPTRTWASFKVQCRACRASYGGYWSTEAEVLSLDAAEIRAAGVRALLAAGCLKDGDGWVCADCTENGRAAALDRYRLAEASVIEPLDGWPFGAG